MDRIQKGMGRTMDKEMNSAYKLVWEDDFNGNKLNRQDWNVELHNPAILSFSQSGLRRMARNITLLEESIRRINMILNMEDSRQEPRFQVERAFCRHFG